MTLHQLKKQFVRMVALAGCAVLTVGGVAPQVLAAQVEAGPTEDTQLASTKLALASALAQAGRGEGDMALLSVGHMWHNCVLGAFLLARKQLYCILSIAQQIAVY